MQMTSQTIAASTAFSRSFPALPILSAIAATCCLLALRSFIITRVFILIFYPSFLIIGNVLVFINNIVWRGNTRNIPIYCDIVAQIWNVYSLTFYLIAICISKFLWTISLPSSSIKVYDSRKQTNRRDAFICMGLPLVLSPIYFILSRRRYSIVEDFGPHTGPIFAVDSFLFSVVPVIVATVLSVGFYARACRNFWHALHSSTSDAHAPPPQRGRRLSNSHLYKYIYFCISGICHLIFGMVWTGGPYILQGFRKEERLDPWYVSIGLRTNLEYYKRVFLWSRDTSNEATHIYIMALTGFAFTLPLGALQFCFCFGLGTELHKIYTKWWPDFTMPTMKLSLVSSFTKWWRRRRRHADPNNYTPFVIHDIILEDLPIPPHVTDNIAGIRRPPISIPPPSSRIPPKVRCSVPMASGPLVMHKSSRVVGESRGREQEAVAPRPTRKGRLPIAPIVYPLPHRKDRTNVGL
ncbi:hypothetical protein FRC19_008463 [Serendipita sp. 401]|nr:hypothetical protein FRC19_008463 [Serendipita sp. 401]KAG9053648.1 hypothetical protein FS842_007560 [Serendipita sp. 407]